MCWTRTRAAWILPVTPMPCFRPSRILVCETLIHARGTIHTDSRINPDRNYLYSQEFSTRLRPLFFEGSAWVKAVFQFLAVVGLQKWGGLAWWGQQDGIWWNLRESEIFRKSLRGWHCTLRVMGRVYRDFDGFGPWVCSMGWPQQSITSAIAGGKCYPPGTESLSSSLNPQAVPWRSQVHTFG